MSISSLLRKKLSLFHEIQTVILPACGYIETIEEETLEEVSATSYLLSNSNVAFADPSGRINPSGVKVFDNDRELELSEYSVNYLTGEVILDAAPSGSITSDYSYYTITVLDAFPDAETFEEIDLPMISIDVEDSEDSPYAIGQQASFWTASFYVDVFALNDSMRIDLMDRIQKFLRVKWIPLLKFDERPISYDGTINNEFVWEDEFIQWIKLKGRSKGRLLNSGGYTDKEKHRAVITGSLTTINSL